MKLKTDNKSLLCMLISLLSLCCIIYSCKEKLKLEKYVDKAEAFYKQNNYNGAIDIYTKAIVIYPNESLLYYNRGNIFCLPQVQSYDLAIHDYERAIDLNPLFYQAYYNCSEAFRNKNEYYRGITMLETAIKIKPNYGFAIIRLAGFYREMGDFNTAIEMLEKANKIELDNPNLKLIIEFNLELFKRDQNK